MLIVQGREFAAGLKHQPLATCEVIRILLVESFGDPSHGRRCELEMERGAKLI